jgi:hypothetical protein
VETGEENRSIGPEAEDAALGAQPGSGAEPEAANAGPALPPAGEEAALSGEELRRVQLQLEEIRRMDPEMTGLEAILRSEAGPRFRAYVERGLDFLDAYTLAARERLWLLRDRQAETAARLRAAGKDHLNATRSRGGQGDLPVPPEELELFRAMMPDTPDAEFRKYWNKSRKR